MYAQPDIDQDMTGTVSVPESFARFVFCPGEGRVCD